MFTAILYVWPTTPWLQLRAGVCVLAVATMRLLNLAVPILYRCGLCRPHANTLLPQGCLQVTFQDPSAPGLGEVNRSTCASLLGSMHSAGSRDTALQVSMSFLAVQLQLLRSSGVAYEA